MCHLCVGVKRLRPDVKIPAYKHEGDSGFDLAASADVSVGPMSRAVIPTGLAFEIPEGFELQVRLRSGAAVRAPLIVQNGPGTVDSGYRGEVKILVYNLSGEPFEVPKGMAVAQGVVCPVARAAFIEENILSETERGGKGFGSTDA